ncbi:hypothetical protein MA16_Dca014927 [Dendrobium catenatum]|uniref:Uncharacterized protein n=1 Tax=Dendrobium catenatum TaxID=906689 RepID=A0A2I0W2V4_9ASPA|nr:hypothetical protein MA16_Dca014927 [Dendrobium catenatum]
MHHGPCLDEGQVSQAVRRLPQRLEYPCSHWVDLGRVGGPLPFKAKQGPELGRIENFVWNELFSSDLCQMASSSKSQKVLAKKPHRNSFENFLSKANEDSFPRVISKNSIDEHVARVSGLVRDARIIQHVLRTLIIPKAGDRINITPLLSMVTFLIMSEVPIDEVQLLLDYLYGLSEIGHAKQKRKRNIALGHLVTYILEKKYNLNHPNQEYEEPLYYNNGSFREIFKNDD